MTPSQRIRVEVAYALPHEQVIVALDLPPGSTARLAIMQSGLLTRFPELDLERNPVGIFGRVVILDKALANGDRVEIYRHLPETPNQRRRARATQIKAGVAQAR